MRALLSFLFCCSYSPYSSHIQAPGIARPSHQMGGLVGSEIQSFYPIRSPGGYLGSSILYAQLSSHRKLKDACPTPRQSTSETQLSAQNNWRTSGMDLPMNAQTDSAVQTDRPGVICSKSETKNHQTQKNIRYIPVQRPHAFAALPIPIY